jgi:hypothetical protein
MQRDLDIIVAWGRSNAVQFNPAKTKLMIINLLRTLPDIDLSLEQTSLPLNDHLEVLGVKVGQSLSWRNHLLSLVSSAARKLGALFRVSRFFPASQLLKIYKANIRPCIEYCSHIWGGSTSVWILERVDRRARRLINDPAITDNMQSLQLRRDVAALSVFYKMYYGRCSTELRSLVPPPARRIRHTRADDNAHPHSLELFNCRIERFKRSFIPRTTAVWNALPFDVFPDRFNTHQFKQRLNLLFENRNRQYNPL